MKNVVDPEGRRLPIKLDATSNGEFVPIPLTGTNREANHLAHEAATLNAKRLGMGRRGFLLSACGAASTLLAFNAANARAGKTGGFFELAGNAALEPQLAQAALEKGEFIFDVQGHFVDPTSAWLKVAPESAFTFTTKGQCSLNDRSGPRSHLACLTPEEFLKDVFMDSDTDMMVLSFVPTRRDASPLTIESADAVRRIVDRMEGNHRLLLHGRVNPNQPGDVEDMEELRDKWKISAWKTYTQWGLDGNGFFLSDDVGIRFIEKARALDVKVICVHKGLPFGKKSYEHSQCSDIGVVAKRFPDVKFLIYHSGFVPNLPEGPFAGEGSGDGIDTLIRSLVENGVKPNSNVYAELGSTWRFLMREPDSAAHALGKLLKYCGQDNVLWGTDSIWYGSPQDQIQAFRTFQISPELREKHGYPEITPALRAKIFGLNATKVYGIGAEEIKLRARGDRVARERLAYLENPQPHFRTYGPKNRREFLNLMAWNGGDVA
ncbi:MAG TPA: amidohydrolase family protein [Burkholderiales bacterium]|jgi:predicted TIM-barrel fold metal-dependent hydrolase|nr:amidohydrolase family protein [Burkholderiales bacterium]